MIVATAGHVDHGKTTLVRALTGQDTDRLPEEKRRGMSIDLGFAFMPSGGGETIAFIDVPGHERFVRNMTAGVHGIDLALLVVAADDGPMPQTFEHLEILELLGAPAVLPVITKIDRVAPERVQEVAGEIASLLSHRRFGEAACLRVCAPTGEGVEALRSRLAELSNVASGRETSERFRMNVDREFVVGGLGLVVTGTALCGSVQAGDSATILPRGLSARVRSLRANSGEAGRARAGQRCALALHGVSRGDVARGDTIVTGEGWPQSRYLDVLLFERRLSKQRARVGVHLGTRALPAQLSLLSADGLARLTFARDLCAWHGERFLLRDTGSGKLLGGGEVVDPQPPARGASKAERLDSLRRMAGRNAAEALHALLAHGPVDLDWLARSWHLSPAEAQHAFAATQALLCAGHAVLPQRWSQCCDAIEQAVGAWHVTEPDWIGIRPQALRATLKTGVPLAVWFAAVDALAAQGRLVKDGPYLRLPAHRPTLSAPDESLWQRVAVMLGEQDRPPRVHELAERLRMEPKMVEAFLERVTRAGLAFRVAGNRFFLPRAIESLAELALRLDEKSGGQGFSAAQYRDASGLGRNLTVQVLEFLDAAGYTKRAGELRRTRPGAKIEPNTEEQRTPVGRPDFKSGERRDASLASSTPASSATSS